MHKKFIKIPLVFLSVYLAFAIIFGVVAFAFITPPDNGYCNTFDISNFKSDYKGPDAAISISDREFSTISKIYAIENASKTLDIAYCQIETGVSADMFFSSLVSAAQRGVKIRLLFDKIFDPFRVSRRDILNALLYQPGIEIGHYGSSNMLTPWRWHNLLHDKIIISDGTLVITGGSNIGDRFFIDREGKSVVYDRDIVIYDTSKGADGTSVLPQFSKYFDDLWESEFTKKAQAASGARFRERARKKLSEMDLLLESIKFENPGWFPELIDWENILIPVKRATLITNPLEATKKEPRILIALSHLAGFSKNNIIVQSPYIIPTGPMVDIINSNSINADITLLTNSIASSPNYFGIAGYINKRRDLINSSDRLYEYHGEGSIHGKTYIFDEKITAVGSFNFDSRSAFLSTESIVVIYDEEFASTVVSDIDFFISKSRVKQDDVVYDENNPVEERDVSVIKNILIWLLRILLYPFDYML